MEPAEYMKEWRKTPAGQAALIAQKRRDKAKRNAARILIERHLNEYDLIFRGELERVENEVSSTRQ